MMKTKVKPASEAVGAELKKSPDAQTQKLAKEIDAVHLTSEVGRCVQKAARRFKTWT